MSNEFDEDAVRCLLNEQLEQLQAVSEQAEDASATVSLDQSRVGRLSRMDALQAQAMAQDTERRRGVAIKAIRSALQRLDNGSYGECEHCEEPIDPRRLKHNPAVLLCISCASKAEL